MCAVVEYVVVRKIQGCRKTCSVTMLRGAVPPIKSYARLMMQPRGRDKRTRHGMVIPSDESGPDIRHTRGCWQSARSRIKPCTSDSLSFCNHIDVEYLNSFDAIYNPGTMCEYITFKTTCQWCLSCH